MSMNTPRLSSSILAALLLGVLSLGSCGGSRTPFGFVHDGQTGLEDVRVTGSSSPDFFGGLGHHLVITHGAEEGLTEAKLIFNDEFRCDLKELLVTRGGCQGTAPFGRSTLGPGESVEFIFSHDISNQPMMQDAEGESLHEEAELTSVTIEAEGQVGRWALP
jgi:hypothetical protein